jgi:hypothetical protein
MRFIGVCVSLRVVINELEASLRNVKLEKVVNKEVDLGIGDVLSLLQLSATSKERERENVSEMERKMG